MFNLDRLLDCGVVLASQSPRRKELLAVIFEKFDVVPAKGEEIIDKNVPVLSCTSKSCI